MAYLIHVLTLIGIYAIMTMSFNLSAGIAGLMNLSHMTFAALGAYTSAILSARYDLPWLITALCGIALAMISSLLWSALAARMQGDQFALISLMIGIVFVTIALNWQSLTRGALGYAGISRPSFAATMESYFIMVWILVALCYTFMEKIQQSPFGRVLNAIRDDSTAAAVLGKNVVLLKTKTLLLCSAIAGLSGVLFAHYIQFLQPTSLHLESLIILLAALVIGGIGSTKGAFVGVFVLFALFEPLRFIDMPSSLVGAFRLMMYALLMMIVILKKPRGLYGNIGFDV